jgi:SNF2 family DNA or RNA helicase
MPSTLAATTSELIFDFPYNKQQVAEVKRVPKAKWDPVRRVWAAPLASLQPAITFARKWGFDIDPDLQTLDIPSGAPKSEVQVIDGLIHIHVPYDRVAVTAVKHIPGVKRDPEAQAWVAPVTSLTAALKFADDFSLDVPTHLRDMEEQGSTEANRLMALSSSRSGDIAVGDIPLRPHQRAAVEYALATGRTFICDDMGLGKSITSIAAVEAAGAYPAVVMCPPNLTLNWKAEYERWLPTRNVAVVRNRKDFPEGYDVVVVGHSNIDHYQDQLKGHRGYILDESHAFKNFDAKRTKAAVKITKKAPMVLCLTGTPITNRPAEFAPQLQILGRLEDFGGKIGYWRYYCAGFKDQWNRWNISGAAHLDELNDRLRGSCMVRRRKEDVLDDLPPVLHNRQIIEVSLGEYRKAEADIVKYVTERAKEIAAELGVSPGAAAVRAKMAAESQEHLVRISVLRRLAAQAKFDAVVEMVDELRDEGRKVVLAAHHRDVVSALADRFGGLRIQGGMTTDEVEAHKARFQTDPSADVITISMEAAKTGHTLTAAADVVFVELPWTPADVDQTYSRCHRIGQKGTVTAHYVLAADTIDMRIYDLIEQKRDVVDAATDGLEVEASVPLAMALIDDFCRF